MEANASRQSVRAVVGAVAALALVAAAGVLVVDDGGDGWKPVDYLGLRIEVPEGFVVQDIEGKVDGELACPDAEGFVFAGPPGEAYFHPRCDLPGEETIVNLIHMPGRGEHSGRRGRVNGLDYRHVSRTSVEFWDLPVLVGVHGPGDKALFEAILASARRSPSRGVATPTTAAARGEVSTRVADELGCVNRTKAATYSRGRTGFLGRQREAPLDCYASDGQYRIIVPDGEEVAQLVVAYYPRVWLVVGPDWVITANDERAARSAHERLGGTLRPPPGGCCGPPTSDRVPGLGG